MVLTESEINRIYETMDAVYKKVDIYDCAFLSAFDKIETLKNKGGDFKLKVHIDGTSYSGMSEDAHNYIEFRIKNGYKNTYHSIQAVLANKLQKSSIENMDFDLIKKIILRNIR